MVINKPTRGRGKTPVASGSQVEVACKALLRLIWTNGLRAGDRLPTHWELCEKIGVSNNSLAPAMRRLVEAGVIARKTKAGTVVVDPNAFAEPLWRVGVAENFENLRSASPYFSLLCACVQNELVRTGCWPRLYLRRVSTDRPADALGDYPELSSDAESGLLDGAIALGSLSREGWDRATGAAPLCGFSEAASCGALIDMRGVIREAVRVLAGRGCERIEVVRKSGHPAERVIRKGFREGIAAAGLPKRALVEPSSAWSHSAVIPGTLTHMLAGGREAQVLLGLPAKRRPDGLVVTDDYMAAGLTSVLREAGGYRPRIAVITHLQAPQIYALPVLRFELDIAELAQRGVAILMERLRNPGLPDRVDWVAPRLLALREQEFPDVGRYGAEPGP